MGVDWDIFARKASAALIENGIAAVISYEETSTGYNITTGIHAVTTTEYDTYAILKNYTVADRNIVDAEDIEIIFHAGTTPDAIPDLLDKDGLKITVDDKTYTVISLQAIRPAGTTMLYKARAKETND